MNLPELHGVLSDVLKELRTMGYGPAHAWHQDSFQIDFKHKSGAIGHVIQTPDLPYVLYYETGGMISSKHLDVDAGQVLGHILARIERQ